MQTYVVYLLALGEGRMFVGYSQKAHWVARVRRYLSGDYGYFAVKYGVLGLVWCHEYHAADQDAAEQTATRVVLWLMQHRAMAWVRGGAIHGVSDKAAFTHLQQEIAKARWPLATDWQYLRFADFLDGDLSRRQKHLRLHARRAQG